MDGFKRGRGDVWRARLSMTGLEPGLGLGLGASLGVEAIPLEDAMQL